MRFLNGCLHCLLRLLGSSIKKFHAISAVFKNMSVSKDTKQISIRQLLGWRSQKINKVSLF